MRLSKRACYRSLRNYKYQLVESYKVRLPIFVYARDSKMIKLNEEGILSIRKGYCWDGPSGPTIDTVNFMRGSLVHDALYQLVREGILSQDERAFADKVLRDICLEDGMSRLRAWYVYKCVRIFGARSARPKTQKPTVITCVPITTKI